MVNIRKQFVPGYKKLAFTGQSQVFTYSFAILVTVLTVLARLSFSPWVNDRPLLVIFFLPILFSAYLGGLGPGLVATFIAAISSEYYLMPPKHSFSFATPMDLVQWLFFIVGGVLTSFLNEALHRARQRANTNQSLYAVTLASIGDAVITTDAQGRITFLNGEAQHLTGWINNEAFGQPLPTVFKIVNEETRLTVEDPVEKVFRTNGVVGLANHTVLIARDGREFIIDDSGAPIRGVDGSIIGVVLVFRDNTAKKRVEDAIRESQALYFSLVNELPAGVFRKDKAGHFVFVNSAFCKLKGMKAEQFLGKTALELGLTDTTLAASGASHHEQIMKTGQRIEVHEEFVHPDGRTLFFEVIKSPTFDANGKIAGSQAIMFDVTERLKVEEAHARLAAIVESSDDAIIGKNLEGIITSWNRGAEQVFGYTAVEAIGRPLLILFPPDREREEREILEKIRRGQTVEHFETVRIRKDGKRIDVSVTISPLKNSNGKIIGASKIARDISEKKRVAEKTAREQARFKLIFDTFPIGIAFHTVHPDGNITRLINDAHLRICGLTRAQHDEPGIYLKITHPDDRVVQQHFADQVNAGVIKQYSMEKRYLHPNDKVVWVNFFYQRETYPDGTIEELTTVTDITEHKRLEEQLRQSQKMEAIGQLAGGVAHDFNNILAIIQLQIGLLESTSELLPLQKDFTKEIGMATQRAANLTRQLLLFSRKQPPQPQDLDLNEIVTDITKMLLRTLGEDVRLQFNLFPEPLFIRADPGMMDQILVNLAVNSRDAMPEGGRLIIETSAVKFDEVTARQSPQARPGAFTCLSVSDTGSGIPPHILPRIFEPFFTTKDVGKGTGLGLATVFGIVQQHQGWVSVYSEVEIGTTIRIYLPRLAKITSHSTAPTMLTEVRGGNETILIVEDEPALCVLVHTVLTSLGYRVLEASNGADALITWGKHREEIKLLLTDMVLPDGMNGKELARRLVLENPKLKVIYASGYSAEVAGKDLILQEGVNFLTKPFLIHKLAQTIRQCLDKN